jgi:flavin reductase (DIM6/NTAB) family NADH-FMN oxidoreductase RutF
LVLCGTYDGGGRPNLAALAWAGVCCSEPPAIQISIRRQRYTYESIMAKKEFTVNIPSSKQAVEADFCGLTSGRSVDKFARAGLTAKRGQFVDAPIVDEFPFCLECRLLHKLDIGSHDMFVGEVLASWMREECLDGDGLVDALLISPLAYAPHKSGGCYYSLGQAVGKAFDVGRKLVDKGETA